MDKDNSQKFFQHLQDHYHRHVFLALQALTKSINRHKDFINKMDLEITIKRIEKTKWHVFYDNRMITIKAYKPIGTSDIHTYTHSDTLFSY